MSIDEMGDVDRGRDFQTDCGEIPGMKERGLQTDCEEIPG
jgi:hypothetical protein